MVIDETIKTWHEDTQKWVQDKIGADILHANEIDKLCLCVVTTSCQYCAAILKLLNNGYEYPAKTLMRCLGELNTKLTWTFVGCHDKDKTPEAIEERIQRWNKTTCSKGIELLEKFEPVVSSEERFEHERALSTLKQSDKELKKSNVKNMPSLENIFKQLGDVYYKQIRPIFYTKFNNAVHLDLACMTDIYFGRTEGHNILITYPVAYAFNINSMVRLRYDLDTNQMKEEYNQIMQD